MHRLIAYLLCLLLLPLSSKAELTGAGDAAIVSKLTAMLKVLNEDIQVAKDMLDLNKHMTNLQENQFIKTISDTGTAVIELYQQIETTEDMLNQFKEDPLGNKAIQRDIATIERRLELAKQQQDHKRVISYGRILQNLKTIKWLAGTTNKAIKKEAKGLSNDEATKQTASEVAKLAKMVADAVHRFISNDAKQLQLEQAQEKIAKQMKLHRKSLNSIYSHLIPSND